VPSSILESALRFLLFRFFVFFGIIFFTAFLAFLAADFAAPGSSIAETFFIAKKQICYAIGASRRAPSRCYPEEGALAG
jgi:hypothetical protein